MSDAVLLSSIKHLLQEDALDWYARAMSQQLLGSWEEFKREIRREFLPSGYSQILRLEASFRFQGANESFAKYYRDISALFRFVDPPVPQDEQFFIVKKNMNADYAAIVTAARPASLRDMMEVCISYDETRMLLNRQRRIPVPLNSLLEPNFATPVSNNRPQLQPQNQQRFGRINALELGESFTHPSTPSVTSTEPAQPINAQEQWQQRIEQLVQEVSALRLELNKRDSQQRDRSRDDTQSQVNQQSTSSSAQHGRSFQSASQQNPVPVPNTWQNNPVPRSGQQQAVRRMYPREAFRQENQISSRGWEQHAPVDINPREAAVVRTGHRRTLLCWNCDEEGHRFMDCPKPQAILFCYRCGRKGYSLRSCYTCRTDAENSAAGNRQ